MELLDTDDKFLIYVQNYISSERKNAQRLKGIGVSGDIDAMMQRINYELWDKARHPDLSPEETKKVIFSALSEIKAAYQ